MVVGRRQKQRREADAKIEADVKIAHVAVAIGVPIAIAAEKTSLHKKTSGAGVHAVDTNAIPIGTYVWDIMTIN